MSTSLQHLLVLLAVAACVVVVGRQTLATLWGRKGRIGQCCARGCGSDARDQASDAANKPQAAKPPQERVVFLPVEMLARKRQSR